MSRADDGVQGGDAAARPAAQTPCQKTCTAARQLADLDTALPAGRKLERRGKSRAGFTLGEKRARERLARIFQ